MTPEFPRPVRLDTIGDVARPLTIDATPAECAALATRFGLVRIDRLHATAALTRDGDTVAAVGRLEADLVQACVATGVDVPQHVEEAYALRFVPEAKPEGEEVELGADDLDEITYVGSAIDVGEAVAQSLALALDPFPRAPDAEAALRAAGVKSEEQASPFAQLLDLKDRLKK